MQLWKTQYLFVSELNVNLVHVKVTRPRNSVLYIEVGYKGVAVLSNGGEFRDWSLQLSMILHEKCSWLWQLALLVNECLVWLVMSWITKERRKKWSRMSKKVSNFYFAVFFKSFYWLWNEPLNNLPPAMKHVEWVFSGFQRVRFLKFLREQARNFNSRSSLTPKTVFASQTGLMYCRQNFYGPAFKMWQINITKQNNTSGPLRADPCHSCPVGNPSRTGTGSRLAARLLPSPESHNTETPHSVLFSTSMRIDISAYNNQRVFIDARPKGCTWPMRGVQKVHRTRSR